MKDNFYHRTVGQEVMSKYKEADMETFHQEPIQEKKTESNFLEFAVVIGIAIVGGLSLIFGSAYVTSLITRIFRLWF